MIKIGDKVEYTLIRAGRNERVKVRGTVKEIRGKGFVDYLVDGDYASPTWARKVKKLKAKSISRTSAMHF